MVSLKNGDKGKVTKIHILSEKFEIMTDRGQIRRYECGLYDPKNKPPENWAFPSSFEHIVNETANLIKLEKDESSKEKASEDYAKDGPREKSTSVKPASNTKREESKKTEDQSRKQHSKRDPRDNKKPGEREAKDGRRGQPQKRRRFRKGRGPNTAQNDQQKKKEPEKI
jgi:hypothetical protein